MKFLFSTILFSASAIAAMAVPLNNKKNTLHRALYAEILQKQHVSNSANKSTGLQRRLIANSYVDNGTLTDTNHYYYSNGRGSTHTTVESYYDEFYITAIEPVHNILCDSSTNSHLYSGTWYKSGTRSYTYDAGARIIKMHSQSYSYMNSYVPSYNSSGKFDAITMYDTMASVPATIAGSKMYIFYNTAGKRIMDSTYNLKTNKPSGKRIFTYDANNNRIRFESYEYNAGAWELTYRNINTYDGSNRMITATSEIDFGMGNGLEMSDKDSFAYTGSNTQPSYHIDYSWDAANANWTPNEILVKEYNTANLLDNYIIIRYTTQWDTIERNYYKYDSNNLLIKSNGYMYVGNGNFSTTAYDQSTMYYEDYYPTSVNNVASYKTVNIYPNPASGIIHINAGITDYSVSIINLHGQVIYTETSIKEAEHPINIKQVPAGSYILSIVDNKGVPTAQKQLIIQ